MTRQEKRLVEIPEMDGAAMRKWRRESGLTQAEFGAFLGVSRTTLYRIERDGAGTGALYGLAYRGWVDRIKSGVNK